MARLADRYLKKEDLTNKREFKQYRAGIYARLSSDRKSLNRKPSDSINSQINIAMDYTKKNSDILVQEIYTDYEYTGTNFKRPAYQRMMEDIREGKINCIIIKDLSRLGREYLEMGTLIEKVFPFLGVRFISVNDRFDSSNPPTDGKSLELVIKNIVNDMYARDASKRIKDAKIKRMEEGYFVGGVPPYGYKVKKLKNGQALEINENISAVVEKIFTLSAKGYSLLKIAETLNGERLTSPMQYYKTGRTELLEGEKASWNVGSLGKLIKNEVYIGDMVQGKKQQFLYKSQEQVYTDEEEWYVVKDTHEPIISRKLFNQVQRALENRRNKSKFAIKRDDFPIMKDWKYKGLFFCGHCGLEMPLHTYVRELKEKTERVYKFVCNRTYKPAVERCGNNIFEYEIDKIVLTTINQLLELANLNSENFTKSNRAHYSYMKLELKKQIGDRERALKNLQEAFAYKYESYVLGKISMEDLLRFKKENDKDNKNISKEVKSLKERLRDLKKSYNKHKKWLDTILENKLIDKLDAEILNALIARIEIYRGRKVSIKFKFDLEFKSRVSKEFLGGDLE